MDQFPGKLREYKIVRPDGCTHIGDRYWAFNAGQAIEMFAQTVYGDWRTPHGFRASSVRRIEDETAETLRDE